MDSIIDRHTANQSAGDRLMWIDGQSWAAAPGETIVFTSLDN